MYIFNHMNIYVHHKYICERMLHSHSRPSNTQDHPPHISPPPHTPKYHPHTYFTPNAPTDEMCNTYKYIHISIHTFVHTDLQTHVNDLKRADARAPHAKFIHTLIHTFMRRPYTHMWNLPTFIQTFHTQIYCPKFYMMLTHIHTHIHTHIYYFKFIHTFIHTCITSNALTRPAHTKSIHTFIKTHMVRAHIPTHIYTHIL